MIGLQIYSGPFLHPASFLLDMSFTIFFSLKWHAQNKIEDNEQKLGLSTDLQ